MKMEPKGRKPASRHTKRGERYHGRTGMGRGTGLTRAGAEGTAPKRRPMMVPPTASGRQTAAHRPNILASAQKGTKLVEP